MCTTGRTQCGVAKPRRTSPYGKGIRDRQHCKTRSLARSSFYDHKWNVTADVRVQAACVKLGLLAGVDSQAAVNFCKLGLLGGGKA
eukprot:3282176-Prymnesium_polylepis.2